jgi:hypothetical protein
MAWLVVIATISVGAVLYYGRAWRRSRRAYDVERRCAIAKFDFRLQRERLEAEFLRIAKERPDAGDWLWDDARFGDAATLARHRYTGELTAYIDVAVEPVSKDVASVDSRKSTWKFATIVFHFNNGRWATDGHAILNLSPVETVRRRQRELELIETPAADWEEAIASS